MIQVNKTYKNGNGEIVKIVSTLTNINLPIPDWGKHTFVGNDGHFYADSGACYNAVEELDLIEPYYELPKRKLEWEYPLHAYEIYKSGGKWLGTLREWIK